MMSAALATMVLAAASLGTVHAYAEAEPYPAEDVYRMLEKIDLFVTLDERYHMVIDEARADASPEVTEADVAMARDYAVHHDALVDESAREHSRGDKTQPSPEMWAAIGDLENGRFGSVFDYNANGDALAERAGSFGDAAVLLIFIYHLVYLY